MGAADEQTTMQSRLGWLFQIHGGIYIGFVPGDLEPEEAFDALEPALLLKLREAGFPDEEIERIKDSDDTLVAEVFGPIVYGPIGPAMNPVVATASP
jgi:hypothetical protein